MSLAASPSRIRSSQHSLDGPFGRPHPAAAADNTSVLLALTSTAATLAPLAGSRLALHDIRQDVRAGRRSDRDEDDAECPMMLAV